MKNPDAESGYPLRDIIDPIDGLRFLSQTEKHELSHLYEAKIKNMRNAGRNGGEYYTPRPLIRTGEPAFLFLKNCNLHTLLDSPGGNFRARA